MERSKDHKCVDKKELLAQTRANISNFGLQVIMVDASDYLPSFAYSIGLFETYQHPEIICFGLPAKLGGDIINDIADLIKDGEAIITCKNYNNIFRDSRAEFLRVDPRNMSDYFGAAFNYYQKAEFSALQLVWTDRNDKFPWEENFEEEFRYDQPLIDRNADFKFREEENLVVFTTFQWLELQEPILQVVHENNGDWQFLTGDQCPDDIRLVSLAELINKDGSLNDVFNLNYGESAERKLLGGEWVRHKLRDYEN